MVFEDEPTYFSVPGDPCAWPLEQDVPSQACAVVVIDMQGDYCEPGYYMDRAGFDLERLRAPIEPIQKVLASARQVGMRIVYTRHDADASEGGLSSLRHRRPSLEPDNPTSARGEPGWEIVSELEPSEDDLTIGKTTINAFASSNLDSRLRLEGIDCLAFCGNTIDVCVHSTLRAAIDLGYECVVLSDCCGAVNDGLHAWALESVKIEGGVFGTVANSEAFVSALRRP